MIKSENILEAVANVLKEATGYRVYESSVIEGFTAPCFFVNVTFDEISFVNISTVQVDASCKIEFFPYISEKERVRADKDSYDIMNTVLPNFKSCLAVENRYLTISEIGCSFLGENSDILQIKFNINYFDSVEKVNDQPVIVEININTEN